MKKYKIIICGVGFGNFYLRALNYLKDRVDLVGIFSRGSEHSYEYANYYDVPLYTQINQIPNNVDLVCVVVKSEIMGGTGGELAKQFLSNGFNVMLEHPVHYQHIVECLKIAKKNSVIFRVGCLYTKLPAVKNFISFIEKRKHFDKIIEIEAECSERLSYPFLLVMGEIMSGINMLKIERDVKLSLLTQLLIGSIGDIPFALRVNHEVDSVCPDSFIRNLFSIKVILESGRVELVDVHGPVIYYPCIFLPFNRDKDIVTGKDFFDKYQLVSNKYIGQEKIEQVEEIFAGIWPKAIADDIAETLLWSEGENDKKFILREEKKSFITSQQWQKLCERFSGCVAVYHNCTEANNDKVGTIDEADINKYIFYMDNASLETMLYAFQANGLLKKGTYYPFREIIEKMQIQQSYVGIIKKWINCLLAYGFIEKQEEGYINNKWEISLETVKKSWDYLKSNTSYAICSVKVVEYFEKNALHILELLTGSVKATYLLFPNGKLEFAEALYQETCIAKYLNEAVADQVFKFAKQRRKVKILELGAGIGATTVSIIHKVVNKKIEVDYTYTDISKFFTNYFKSKNTEYNFINYGELDINKSFRKQNYTGKYDIIVAAGVLNNSNKLQYTLANIKDVLAENGMFIITEPVREFPQMLISQVFMMEEPSDIRNLEQTTFLTVNEWKKILKKEGFIVTDIMPNDNNALSGFGQKMLVARKKNV